MLVCVHLEISGDRRPIFSVTMSVVPVVTLRPSWYLGKSTQGLSVGVLPGFSGPSVSGTPWSSQPFILV